MFLTSLSVLLITQTSFGVLGAWGRQNSSTRELDNSAWPISTTGRHAWIAPGPGDQRGPCPGLNSLANHGYLPHNGIASILQMVEATNTVFGMGAEIALVLSALGAVMDGDGLKFSIGGADRRVGLPLFGVPRGLSGSHNKYESDASPTRGDLYLYGNNYKVVPEQFGALYALQLNETEETSNYDIPILTEYRATRFQDSIDNNPYFFNDVVSGLLVQPGAYIFQSRLMANHSGDPNYPDGQLSKEMLKSFFGVSGEYPNFEITHGHERIPDNWYRRPEDYSLTPFLLDVIEAGLEHPRFLTVGGNLGRTNTFTGVDLSDLTGGVYHAQSLLQPGTLGCFLRQVLMSQEPDLVVGPGLLAGLLSALDGLVPEVTCRKLARMDLARAFAAYPGYTKLKGGVYA